MLRTSTTSLMRIILLKGKEGSTAVLYGNLAPEGAVIKQSALVPEMMAFTGPATVFESEQDALTAFREGTIKEGSVLVVRNEGPKGGPSIPTASRMWPSSPTAAFPARRMVPAWDTYPRKPTWAAP